MAIMMTLLVMVRFILMVIGNFLMGIEINDFWLGRHPLVPNNGRGAKSFAANL